MEKYYLNTRTGEVTENHKTAVGWYREGANVEIWRYNKKENIGQLCLTWEH